MGTSVAATGDTRARFQPVHWCMSFDAPSAQRGPVPPAAATPDAEPCIGLEEALRLSTGFSASSNRGEIPGSLEIPIPSERHCTFVVKRWSEVNDAEREAFRRFYVRVGGELEDLAQRAGAGADIDETLWTEITGRAPGGAAGSPPT